MDVSKLPIDVIGLSVRSQHALTRAGCYTVGQLMDLSEEELFSIPHLGKKSVEEILQKQTAYKEIGENAVNTQVIGDSISGETENLNFDAWISEDNSQQLVLRYLKKTKTKISDLAFLSVKAYNLLSFRGYDDLEQIVFMTEEQLQEIPRMDKASAHEIAEAVKTYLEQMQNEVLAYAVQENVPKSEIPARALLFEPAYQKSIQEYIRINNVLIDNIGLTKSSAKKLKNKGYKTLLDIAFLRPSTLFTDVGLSQQAIDEFVQKIEEYVQLNASRINAFCRGDNNALWDDESLNKRILSIFNSIGFSGLSLQELVDKIESPVSIDITRIKKILGQLIKSGVLEYVDYRCFRIYPRFEDYLMSCPDIDPRNKSIVQMRLQGSTLEEVAQECGLTRERVRQIVKQQVKKVRKYYIEQTGGSYFDEDYYQYLYSTYKLDKKDSIKWLGISQATWQYLETIDLKPGTKELSEALEDRKGLEVSQRLKIKNYLNRNKLYIDETWVEKKRSDLEKLVVKKFCRQDVSFDCFTKIYNDFLEQEDIPYDEKLYYTKAIHRTRKNRLAAARFLLWKQNEMIRYYDIDSRDYTDFLDRLNLSSYENIEISTEKLVRDYPDLMRKYDIHDRYELHNLLKKILPEGAYHNFHSCRTPNIRFGEFDRNSAIFDIMAEMSPVSAPALAEAVSREYGYDAVTVASTYLQAFAIYNHQNVYSITQKVMSPENQNKLKSALREDFYYFDEIRKIYQQVVPGADVEEINPYNLKNMGFVVLSRYAVQNYSSLESYYEHLLTSEDMINVRPYRERFASVIMFSQKLMALKRSLTVIEYAPDRIINIRKLEQAGITKQMICEYCDDVYDAVDDNTYFSVRSLRLSGFQSKLDDLGFEDWFYANLLIADNRFSSSSMFGTIILYKGENNITIGSFANTLIQRHGSVDVIDLTTEIAEKYGCNQVDKWDLIYKAQGTGAYYDRYLERFYANENLYYRELESVEEV